MSNRTNRIPRDKVKGRRGNRTDRQATVQQENKYNIQTLVRLHVPRAAVFVGLEGTRGLQAPSTKRIQLFDIN